jgi:phosphoglycolate phosphatase
MRNRKQPGYAPRMTKRRTGAPWRAAIIDLDGTLVDTIGDFQEALARTLRELGLPPIDREAVALRVGKGSEHLIRSVLAHVDAPASLYDLAWEAYQRHYLTINGQMSVVYPGAVAALQAMRQLGLRLACVTNKPGEFARPLLRDKGLLPFFEHVFGGDAFEKKKPDPLPLLRTCEALGTTAPETLVVGDSSNDAQAARAAGCPVWLVTFGYNHGEPVAAVPADGHFSSWADLAKALPARGPAARP